MDSTLTGAKFSSCIGFAMAETAPVFVRPSELQPFQNHALDLNKHALDLNSMAVFSSEAPLRFELYPFVQARPYSACAYVAANFWVQQPGVSIPWIQQAVAPCSWTSQVVNGWNFDLPSRIDFAHSSLELREERERNVNRALPERKGHEIQPRSENRLARLVQLPVNDQAQSVKDTSAKPQQFYAKDQVGTCSDTAPKPTLKIVESPDWLPRGWITEVKTRKAGSTAGTKDKYYKDPISGRRFRSRNEVIQYLQTGWTSRYKPKLPPQEGGTNASDGASLGRSFNAVTCNVGAQHGVETRTESSTGLGAQPNYSAPVGPEVCQPDAFSKVGNYKITSLAPSVPCISNQLLEIPDWLNKILPVGHLHVQDFLNRQNEVGFGIDQSSAGVLQGGSKMTNMQEYDNEDIKHRAISKLLPENKDGNINAGRELEANFAGSYPDLRPKRNHDAVGEQPAKDRAPDEQFVFHRKGSLSYTEMPRQPVLVGALGQENTTPAMQSQLLKHTLNAGQISQPSHVMQGQYQKNVTSAMLEQPLRDMVNMGHNGSGIAHQTKGSWTNQMGVKKAQKMKPRRGKELLVLLGRKLCWQGLGLIN